MLAVYPMHGQSKLSREGYRTRDGHIIEWFGSLASEKVRVISRPEPFVNRRAVYDRQTVAKGTVPVDTWSRRMPSFRDRRRWWISSVDHYPAPNPEDVKCVVWNPLIGLNPRILEGYEFIHVDLLDDWTIHHAFKQIRNEAHAGYKQLFERADSVTANSEGTLRLAASYGRTDAHLLLNGCDPERFKVRDSRVEGAHTIVGYVGKIGLRLDLDCVRTATAKNPSAEFVFAGPVLDRSTARALRRIDNVSMIGDIHYRNLPKLLSRFDLGWVPHCVGPREVGGDVLKTYEYRAAGLPVLSTPVMGAGSRGLSEVFVQEPEEHGTWIAKNLSGRTERRFEVLPEKDTWKYKARFILNCMSNQNPSEDI